MRLLILKDSLRELLKNKGKFFAILSLIMISVFAYAGISTAVQMLYDQPSDYYQEVNLQDIVMISTYGFDDGDMEILDNNQYIKSYEVTYFVDVKLEDQIIRIQSLAEDLSQVKVHSGRLPESRGEIALWTGLEDMYSIGDVITVDEAGDEEFLKSDTFEVVGFVESGEFLFSHITEPSTIGGGSLNGYSFVVEDVFDMEYPPVIKIKAAENDDIYSDEYDRDVTSAKESLEGDFEDRPKIRLIDIREEALEFIEDSEELLDSSERKLRDGRASIEHGKSQINDGLLEINQSKDELAAAKTELDNGWLKYNQEKSRYDREIRKGREELKSAKLELDRSKELLESEEKKLNEGYDQYQDGLRQYQAAVTTMEESQARLNREEGILNAGKLEYEKGLAQYKSSVDLYNQGITQYQKGLNLYNDNLIKYQQGKFLLSVYDYIQSILKFGPGGDIKDIQNQLDSSMLSRDNIEKYIKQLEDQIIDYENQLREENLDNIYKTRIESEINRLKILLSRQIQNRDQLDLDIQRLEDKLNQVSKQMSSLGVGSLEELLKDPEGWFENLRTDLAYAEEQLKSGKLELEKSKEKIQQGKTELIQGKSELDRPQREIAAGERELNLARLKLKDGQNHLESESKKLENSYHLLESGRRELEAGWEEYRAGLELYQENLALFESERMAGKIALNQARETLKNSERQYKDGLKELQVAEAKLRSEKYSIEEKDRELTIQERQGYQEIADGRETIEKSRRDLMDLDLPEYMVDERKDDQAYLTIYEFPFALKYLIYVFSFLALSVATLVTSTTMKRFIDEDRTVLGTFKGLGMYNKEILIRYLFFGGTSGVVGGILGAILGQKVLGPLIYNIYMSGSIFVANSQPLDMGMVLIGVAIGAVTTIGVVLFTIDSSLKDSAAELMRPKVPTTAKSLLIERIDVVWDRLSFIGKITMRNIFRYKGRMAMTILGVGVCMALLILGFGMEYSITGVVDKQYEEILTYDYTLYIAEDEQKSVMDQIEASDEIDGALKVNVENIKLKEDEETHEVQVYTSIGGDYDGFVEFRDNGEDLSLSSSGVILTQKLADILGLSPGDSIDLEIDGVEYNFNIDGVMENYMAHSVYMDEEDYSGVTGTEPTINSVLIKSCGDMESYFEDVDGVLGTVSNEDIAEGMVAVTGSFDNIVLIIILVAMLLAIVVLYSLTDVNISERIRELATMKVLGFFPMEITQYVFRETLLLSVLGIGLGSFIGMGIVDFILDKFAPSYMMFADPNYCMSILKSGIMTLIFTGIIMVIMHRKLKNIDMLEALASVE